MRVSFQGQGGLSKNVRENHVMAKNAEALVIPLDTEVFLVNGNPHVGKSDSFHIVGRYETRESALNAAEEVFERLKNINFGPKEVQANKKRAFSPDSSARLVENSSDESLMARSVKKLKRSLSFERPDSPSRKN